MWILLFFHAIFASTYTLGKLAIEYVQPIFLVGVRMTIGGLLLLAIRTVFGWNLFIKKHDIVRFLALAFFEIYCAYVLMFMVLDGVSSTKWALTYTLTPFVVALISYFKGKEQITWLKCIGLIIGFVGIIPVLLFNGGTCCSLDTLWHFTYYDVVMIISMVSYSYGWVLARELIKERKYDATMVYGIAMFLGGVGALCTSPFIDSWSPFPLTAWWPFIILTSFLVLTGTLAFTVNGYLLRFYTATFLTFVMFIDPLYVAIYARFFLKEAVSPFFLISMLLVIFGLFLFYKEELTENIM